MLQAEMTNAKWTVGKISLSRSGLLLTIVIFLFAAPLPGAGYTLSGYSKAYLFNDPNTGEYTDVGSRFQTLFQGGDPMTASWFAAVNYDYNSGGEGAGQLTLRPVEYYLDLAGMNYDLRIGRQFIFWGKASWVNPTDILNPWDYQNISAEIEDYRIPVWALNYRYYLGQLTFQTILLPRFTPAVIPMPNMTKVLPENSLENTQFAFRVLSWIGQTDLSLSYYHGFDDSPSILFKGMNLMNNPPSPILEQHYMPRQMLGADMARAINALTLKAEAAYFINDDRKGDDPAIENSNIEYVAGLDWVITDKFSLTGQYSSKILLNYNEESERAAISANNMQDYFTASPPVTHSISGVLKSEVLPYTDLQILHVYNLHQKDNFTLAFLSWEMRDALHLTGGCLFFNGPDNSPFGRSDDADKIFAELKFSF